MADVTVWKDVENFAGKTTTVKENTSVFLVDVEKKYQKVKKVRKIPPINLYFREKLGVTKKLFVVIQEAGAVWIMIVRRITAVHGNTENSSANLVSNIHRNVLFRLADWIIPSMNNAPVKLVLFVNTILQQNYLHHRRQRKKSGIFPRDF